MRQLLVILFAIALSGCFGNQDSLQTYQQTANTDPETVSNYRASQSSLEEYVSRVGKRVLLVSQRPTANYHFHVANESESILSIDPNDQTITISTAVLRQLKDEAQLAAALGLAINKLNYSHNLDRDTANDLVRAGYDPHAMLEIQQEYFYATNNKQSFWLSSVYAFPPTAGTITANKTMLQKMPQGLLRGDDIYQKQMNS